MADLLVNVPKFEQARFWDITELEEWRIRLKTERLEPGDFIWFSMFGKLVAKARVSSVQCGGKCCGLTGCIRSGCIVILHAEDFERLSGDDDVSTIRGLA